MFAALICVWLSLRFKTDIGEAGSVVVEGSEDVVVGGDGVKATSGFEEGGDGFPEGKRTNITTGFTFPVPSIENPV
jgi:hypothetical protein